MYVDTKIEEGTLIEQLSAIIKEGGFTVKNRITKIGFPVGAGTGGSLEEKIVFSVARHTLLQHNLTKMMYGLAEYNEIEVYYGVLPVDSRKSLETASSYVDFTLLAEWIIEQSDLYKFNHTFYTYMAESYSLEDAEPPVPYMAAHEEPKRFALDLEVMDTTLKGVAQLTYPNHFQSPITPVHLRIPSIEKMTFTQPVYAPHVKTNWWHDSKVQVRGVVTDTHIFLLLLADTAPAYQRNVVPLIPLFWGLFIPEKPDDNGNLALFSGSAWVEDNPEYDFDDPTPFLDTTKLMPLLKDYVEFVGNGIDDIVVYRTLNGSRYQQHRLIAEVESNIIPPPRQHEGMQYPRAWQDNMHSAAYQYQMNPSRYSKRIETSKPIIYHAEEGRRGTIPDCLVSNPLSIRNYSIFKERVQTCPDVYDLYRYFLIEGVSPFTKIPTTPFRPLGIALKMTEEKPTDWQGNLEHWQGNPLQSEHLPATPPEMEKDKAIIFKPDGEVVKPTPDPDEPKEEDVKEEYYLLLCNGTWDSGCVYKARLNETAVVNQVDIESGGHKFYPLEDGILKNGVNRLTVEAVKSEKEFWQIIVFRQPPNQELDSGDLTVSPGHDISEGDDVTTIIHVTIGFEDITVKPPTIATGKKADGNQTPQIILDGNKVHIDFSIIKGEY